MNKIVFAAIMLLFAAQPLMAQEPTAVDVLDKVFRELEAVDQKYVVYQSTMAHSDNLRKAEKRRQDLVNQVTTSRQNMAEIPYYKGDKMLHQAVSEYLKLLDYNLNDDYEKLVNMKEIAEQSYDKMEAYIMVKDKVSEKMKMAGNKMDSVQKAYCAKYQIKLIENTSELGQQLEKISEVSKYDDKLYLVFFKCQLMEDDLMEAVEKKNVNSAEQIRSSLKSFAEEGLAILDTMKSFHGDASLMNACKRSMEFFKKEAERAAEYSDYITKETAFLRLKDQFESDKDMRKDKAAVDKYNQSINEMNKASQQYNNTNQYLNNYRKETYTYWNDVRKAFFDRHIPVAS